MKKWFLFLFLFLFLFIIIYFYFYFYFLFFILNLYFSVSLFFFPQIYLPFLQVKKVKGSIIQQKKLLAQREGKEYVLSKEEEEWVEEGAGGGVAEKGTPKRGVKLSSLIKGSPASKRHRILFN